MNTKGPPQLGRPFRHPAHPGPEPERTQTLVEYPQRPGGPFTPRPQAPIAPSRPMSPIPAPPRPWAR